MAEVQTWANGSRKLVERKENQGEQWVPSYQGAEKGREKWFFSKSCGKNNLIKFYRALFDMISTSYSRKPKVDIYTNLQYCYIFKFDSLLDEIILKFIFKTFQYIRLTIRRKKIVAQLVWLSGLSAGL